MMVYVLTTIKICHLFSLLCQRRWVVENDRKRCSHFENRCNHTKLVENKIIDFSVSIHSPLLFSKKKYQVFWSSLGSCQLQLHCVKTVQLPIFFWLYFPVFRLNTEFYSVNLHIQSEYKKTWTRTNSLLDTFHAVQPGHLSYDCVKNSAKKYYQY